MLDMLLLIGGFLLTGIMFLLLSGSGRQRRLEKRIGKIKDRRGVVRGGDKKLTLKRQLHDDSLSYLTTVSESLGFFEKLHSRLEIAGLKISVEKYILMCLGLAALIMLIVAGFIGKPPAVAIPLGFAIGLGVPHFYVGFRIVRHQRKFLRLFPDAIDLIVRGLRAGLPVAKSMHTVADEIEDPVRSVFRDAVEQIALGVPMEKALLDIAKRLGLTEFDFFATSIILQRETGGNLAEILSNLSEVLRQRTMFQLKIKALSSEARASAVIVGALPFLVFGILSFVSPDYLQPFYDDYRGNMMGLVAFGVLGMGMFTMAKLSKFEM